MNGGISGRFWKARFLIIGWLAIALLNHSVHALVPPPSSSLWARSAWMTSALFLSSQVFSATPTCGDTSRSLLIETAGRSELNALVFAKNPTS